MKKPSFLERLTGSVNMDEYDKVLGDDAEFTDEEHSDEDEEFKDESEWHSQSDSNEKVQQEGELPVDMYQTSDAIVIRALVAGVSPDDLDIAITRDRVTIRGLREEIQESPDENYFHRELFWGSFSRTLLLPEEILIDEADAKEKHGLLQITLPKVDKERTTKLKVKSHASK